MNCTQGFARRDFIAYFFVYGNAHCGINRIFFTLAPSAENDASSADLFTCNR